MKVEKLRLKSITRHVDTEIALPDRGVVLVTGPNGRGKSTLLEGTAFGGWKKSLRGTPCYVDDTPGLIEITTPAAEIRRKITKAGSVSLSWNLPGEEPVKYETQTKAQEALEQVIGDFGVWSRACTFSKANASKAGRFASATDAERKGLLETILGLDYFDAALKRCRTDLKALREEAGDLRTKIQTAEVREEGAVFRLAEVKRDLDAHVVPAAQPAPQMAKLPPVPEALPAVETTPPAPPVQDPRPAPPSAEELALVERIRTLEASIQREEEHDRALSKELEGLATAGVAYDTEAASEEARFKNVQAGLCPECEQEVSPEHRQRFHARVARARELAETARTQAAEKRAQVTAQREEAAMNLADFRRLLTQATAQKAALVQRLASERKAAQEALQARMLAEWEAQGAAARAAYAAREAERSAALAQRSILEDAYGAALRAWQEADRARQQAEARKVELENRRTAVEAELAKLRESIEAHRAEAIDLTTRIKVKEAAEFALSPKGFRAHILARTLKGLESCANSWLAELGYGAVTVELSPYSEKKDGDLADAISLKVQGVGHAHGYRGCSDGEQRRIDIAFLLALMEVSTGALGATDSTLWLDEVFDALDVEGTRAVCSLLDRLSQERTVVVIAHSTTLIQALRPTMILEVAPDAQNPEATRVVVRNRSSAAA